MNKKYWDNISGTVSIDKSIIRKMTERNNSVLAVYIIFKAHPGSESWELKEQEALTGMSGTCLRRVCETMVDLGIMEKRIVKRTTKPVAIYNWKEIA